MTIQTSTLRPGLLVSLKTSVTGNVTYTKKIIAGAHRDEAGKEVARWETERTITDPVEHEAAKKARSKARSLINGICAHSAFGLLCPEQDAEMLEKAVLDARAVADEFNATAKLSRVGIYVLTGRIAPDDVEAVKAINSEVRELLGEMAEGIKNLDVKAVRDAADRAKSLGMMLNAESADRVQVAVETARKAARKIVAAGEQAAAEIDLRAVRQITDARTMFLDLDDAREVLAPQARGRAIDFVKEG